MDAPSSSPRGGRLRILRVARRFRSGLARMGSHERDLLVGFVLVLGALWGFLALADEVTEGETHEIDRTILLAFRNPADLADPIGPPWLEEMGREFTALGGVGVLATLTFAAAGFFLLHRKPRTAGFLVASITSGFVLGMLLKDYFGRARPNLVPHASIVYSASFPSGHSLMSALTYLTLAALAARSHPRLSVRAYLLGLGLLLTLLVGLSRIYVGVHWPTDVLAGWTLGAGWALLSWVLARARSSVGATSSDHRHRSRRPKARRPRERADEPGSESVEASPVLRAGRERLDSRGRSRASCATCLLRGGDPDGRSGDRSRTRRARRDDA